MIEKDFGNAFSTLADTIASTAIEDLEYDRRSIEVKAKYDKVFEELKFAFGEYAPYAYAEFLSGKPARFFLDDAEIESWREIFAKDDQAKAELRDRGSRHLESETTGRTNGI